MNVFNAITIGFKEIWAHKFRSALTMLGIVLGVSSLVGMSALVKGMENGMRESLIAIGGVERVSVNESDIPAEQRQLADQAVGMTVRDAYALQRGAPLIKLVTPEMTARDSYLEITHGGKYFTPWRLVGTWPSALEMNQHVVEYGRMFNEVDDDNASCVCVIGTAARDELFGSEDQLGYEYNPVGDIINIGQQPFTIIGMFQRYESETDRKAREVEKNKPPEDKKGVERSKGWGGKRGNYVFYMKNATIYIPLNTMWLRYRAATGTNGAPNPKLSGLTLKVADMGHFEESIEQAQNVLMQTHRGIKDFAFQTQENWAETIGKAIHNARFSGGIIAAISLLVGGIGIMNIMLASITERIREIGIRKAIGATFFDVFIQILVESVVLAVIGGAAGLVTSLALVNLLGNISPTDNAPEITLNACVIAFGFSVGIGVLAGLFPAFKAARLDPIQALRYE
jgi:putative ABC transport system permease protein